MENRELNQVESFKYLGGMVCEDRKCDKDLRMRIVMEKASFGQMRKVLTNLQFNIDTRKRVLKAYVWSVLLFGCESWTISKDMRRKLEATEMWFLRRM